MVKGKLNGKGWDIWPFDYVFVWYSFVRWLKNREKNTNENVNIAKIFIR